MLGANVVGQEGRHGPTAEQCWDGGHLEDDTVAVVASRRGGRGEACTGVRW